MTNTVLVHVAAVVNMTKRTATIEHVTPLPGSPKATPKARDTRLAIRTRAEGKVSAEHPVQFKPDLCKLRRGDETGLVDAIIALDSATSALELLIDGQPVARFDARDPPSVARDLQVRGPVSEEDEDAESAAAPQARFLTLSWKDPSKHRRGGPRYIVQASTDGGTTWRTLVLSTTQTKAQIDPSDFATADKVRFRILTTNGIRYTETATVDLRVSDLFGSGRGRRKR